MQNPTVEQLRAMNPAELRALKTQIEAEAQELHITNVGEEGIASTGQPFFTIKVKEGNGRKTNRTCWGTLQADGTTLWQNFSPTEALMQSLTSVDQKKLDCEVVTAAIEPREVVVKGKVVVDDDNNPILQHEATVVRLTNESVNQALKRSGYKPLGDTTVAPAPAHVPAPQPEIAPAPAPTTPQEIAGDAAV